MTRISLRAAGAVIAFSTLLSTIAAQATSTAPAGPITTADCYSSIPEDFTNKGSYTFQTSGYCQGQCAGFSVMAISQGSTCWCGNELPADSDKTSSSSCNSPCQGFDAQMCGGTNAFQLYLTGGGTVGSAAGGSSGSSTSGKPTTASSAVPSVVTQSGKVVTVTAAAAESSGSSSGGGGGSNKVAIAVGVVVGLLQTQKASRYRGRAPPQCSRQQLCRRSQVRNKLDYRSTT
jgi:cell wall integrity and stress response component